MKKTILIILGITTVTCATNIVFPWSSQTNKISSLIMDDVEALSQKEDNSNNNTFKTWVETGHCYEKNTSGQYVEVATYRICGPVDLGFTKKDDCKKDEDCSKGIKHNI